MMPEPVQEHMGTNALPIARVSQKYVCSVLEAAVNLIILILGDESYLQMLNCDEACPSVIPIAIWIQPINLKGQIMLTNAKQM